MGNPVKQLTGKRFGMLTVLSFSHTDQHAAASWVCRCECGKTVTVTGNNLSRANTLSCGCYMKGRTGVTHGLSGSSEYEAYRAARKRCRNPKHKAYPRYGGRGIEFRFTSFAEFFAELGKRPDGHSLDRINNDGHYEKGNVRWATRKTQQNNRSGLNQPNKEG